MDQLKIVDHFAVRANGFEEYSNWTKNEEFLRLCLAPVEQSNKEVKCLDLGGGSGWLARTDKMKSNREWMILDISFSMAKYLKGILPFINGDAHDLPFKNNCFDFVVIRSVLHYVNAEKVLKEVRRILYRDGFLVIAQKVRENFEKQSDWHKKFIELRNTLSAIQWTKQDLEELSKSLSFGILQSHIFIERRKANFEKWLSRDGTIPPIIQKQIRNHILNIPLREKSQLDLKIIGSNIVYNRKWAVIYLQKRNDNNKSASKTCS